MKVVTAEIQVEQPCYACAAQAGRIDHTVYREHGCPECTCDNDRFETVQRVYSQLGMAHNFSPDMRVDVGTRCRVIGDWSGRVDLSWRIADDKRASSHEKEAYALEWKQAVPHLPLITIIPEKAQEFPRPWGFNEQKKKVVDDSDVREFLEALKAL